MTSNDGAATPTTEEKDEPATTGDAAPSKRRVLKFVIPLAIILVIAYVAGILAFKSSDGSFTISGDDTQVQSGIQVTASMVAIEPASEQLSVRLQFTPVGEFADQNGDLTKNVTVFVNAYSGKTSIDLPKGKPAAPEQIKLYSAGNWSQYPLDTYEGTLYVDATTGADNSEAVPVSIEAASGLAGWSMKVTKPDSLGPNDVPSATFTLSRPFVTKAYAGIVLFLFILIALVAVFVAIAVGGMRRRIEPALLGWGAALLFAVPALRNAMPGAPPIGAWIDVLVFLWVIVLVIIAYLVVVATWIRKSPPPQK